MQLTVVYQAYGRWDIIQQAMFSSVSLCRQFPNGLPFEIQIYSDQTAQLQAFYASEPKIKLVSIKPDQIQKWRGAINFVHRVKLEILKQAAQGSPNDIVYFDGDTVFKSSPIELFGQITDRISLMHIRESTLGDPGDLLTKKIGKFVKKKKFAVGSDTVEIPMTTAMWNAGVIGLSKKNTLLFDQMIAMTDSLYSQYQKHVMEQLAVSYYLQSTGEVRPCDQVVLHYWSQKEQFDQAIQQFIGQNSTLKACIENFSQFKWPTREALQKKKKSFLQALFGK